MEGARPFRAELQGKTILMARNRYHRYGGDPHESFVCVYLNNKHHVVNAALRYDFCTGIPSSGRLYFNVAEPSEADITVTRRLQAALNTVDIRVLDHLVLAEQDVVSLAERRSMV